jgi:methionyl-tRNA formyltransferase
MSKIIIIGGIESTYKNAQVLYELGEEILMFFTRGQNTPGWDGVGMVDQSTYTFANNVPTMIVENNINDFAALMKELNPDFIYSLGWQQIYKSELLDIAPFIGIHESLLPRGAGPVPIANAILRQEEQTGCTLFWLDDGMDTGPIIGQLKNNLSPLTSNSSAIYEEGFTLSKQLLEMYVPHINKGTAPRIEQNLNYRTEGTLLNWSKWPDELVSRARVYPYV